MARIKVSLKTKTDKTLEKGIKDLKDGYVRVGWIKGEKYKNGLYVAENAYIQNKGFTIKHKNGKQTYVPPRPFLNITIDRYSKDWTSLWKELYRDVLDEKIKLSVALNKLGIRVKTNIQDTIVSSDGIRPNRPSTIESKKRKGSPLIPLMDTKKMFDSINYESVVGGK